MLLISLLINIDLAIKSTNLPSWTMYTSDASVLIVHIQVPVSFLVVCVMFNLTIPGLLLNLDLTIISLPPFLQMKSLGYGKGLGSCPSSIVTVSLISLTLSMPILSIKSGGSTNNETMLNLISIAITGHS